VVLARARRTLRERGLLRGGERVLVACSGGPDSSVLLHVLARLAPDYGLSLVAASVDHGLRADAAREVSVAGALADRLGVDFVPLRVRVERRGPSLQDKARAARYEVLLAEAERRGASLVAVGHTREDQAETVLARLLRGSALVGLGGIEPRRDDGVIRPLIDCARADVRAYATRHALPFVEDPSNVDEAFTRARLRKEVLPALARESPRVVEHLARLADEARAMRAWVEAAAERLLAEASLGSGALDAARLLDAPEAVRTEALARWVGALLEAPARRAHLEGLDGALRGRGEVLLPRGLRARCDEGVLSVRHAPGERVRGRSGRASAARGADGSPGRGPPPE
jgi:tRNA(Ile)-lysidine synthase